MPRAGESRLSRTEVDGGHLALPGIIPGFMADRRIFTLNSGLLDMVNAVTEQGAFLMPAPATLLAVVWRVRVQLGTGAGLAQFGKQGSDGYFSSTSVAISLTAGSILNATLLQTVIAKNDVLRWTGDGGATTTGSVDGLAILALD